MAFVPHTQAVKAVIDFGDVVHAPTIFNLAIATAYAAHDDTVDPLGATLSVIQVQC